MHHQRPDPATRFTDRVWDYDAYRPRYPRTVLALLRREIGLRSEWIVADIGSGTGLSSELFIENGNVVYGVEPNVAMREAAEARLRQASRFHSVDGRAEATGLADCGVDLVVCAQAFHWFEPQATRREFLRILRPEGWTVLLWNSRRTDGTPFLRGYERLLLTHGTDYRDVRHDRDAIPTRTATLFGRPFERRVVYNEQRLDLNALRGRLLSSSYVPAERDPAREPMLHALEDLFDAHQRDGTVLLEYDTEVYFGPLRNTSQDFPR